MAIRRASLSKSLAVSTSAVWIASLICFYFLEFHDRVLLRTLGPAPAYLLAGLAGVAAYASIYSVFLGTGLGTILWYAQSGD